MPPKSVVKLVESTSTMSPARCSFGGIQSRQLNSVLPAALKGCGRSRSMGWRASICTDLVVRGRQLIVGKVRMEIQSRHVFEQPQAVNIPKCCERRDILRPLDDRGTESPAVVHGYVEALHKRTRVLSKSLLARNEAVAVVPVLNLALLHVLREAHIMMRREQQAGAFPF